MNDAIATFANDESGAVTVDWVVLTAALVGIGMVVLMPIVFSTDSATQGVADYIAEIEVGYTNKD